MRRASRAALALMVGITWFSANVACGQYGMPGPAGEQPPAMMPGEQYAPQDGSYASYSGSPYGAPQYGGGGSPYADPAAGAQWYGSVEDNQAVDQSVFKLKFVDGFYFRTEYLNWDIKKPGGVLLGSPVNGNPNPDLPFTATSSGGIPIGTAIVPTTKPFDLRGINGIRAVMGMDLTYGGTVEVGAFALDWATSGYKYNESQLIDSGNLIATSTMVNGLTANNLYTYNEAFSANYFSQLWGTEANYLFDVGRGGLFELRPLAGLRYIALHERLDQQGVFRDFSFASPIDTVSSITSTTYNNMVGPQFGARFEMVTQWFSVGVEPKVGLMANNYLATVQTDHFRSNSDPQVITKDRSTFFSPVFDNNVYAKVWLTKWFALRVGYSFMYLGRITRPENNIYYNDNGPFIPPLSFIPPDVTVSPTRHDIVVQGITVGGEVRW